MQIYDPNFRTLLATIENIPNDNRIVGGDINLVLHFDKDKSGGRFSTHKQARDVLINWMEGFDMVDVWRAQHKNLGQYTFYTTHPSEIACRLDFFLVSFGQLLGGKNMQLI